LFPVSAGIEKKPKRSFCCSGTPGPVAPVRGSRAVIVSSKRPFSAQSAPVTHFTPRRIVFV
jgi:hypothetical protein